MHTHTHSLIGAISHSACKIVFLSEGRKRWFRRLSVSLPVWLSVSFNKCSCFRGTDTKTKVKCWDVETFVVLTVSTLHVSFWALGGEVYWTEWKVDGEYTVYIQCCCILFREGEYVTELMSKLVEAVQLRVRGNQLGCPHLSTVMRPT